MNKIKIKFVDFWTDFSQDNNFITKILRKKYEIEISDEPDYVFCSVFGKDYLQYNCVRIFYTGESVCPDFNFYDYALGYDTLDFGDRYIRMPLFYWGLESERNNFDKSRIVVDKSILDSKTGFCNFVYSNKGADSFRAELFLKLNQYKKVDSGGNYLNNIGYQVKDKVDFCRNYKFTIACENSVYTGYTSEKILDAFRAQSIPIYWGNESIGLDFNKDAFICCHDFTDNNGVINLGRLLNKIKHIDENDDLFLDMINRPIYNFDVDKNIAKIEDFLFHIFDQPLSQAFRRNQSYFGNIYERNQRFYSKIDNVNRNVPKGIKNVIKRFI